MTTEFLHEHHAHNDHQAMTRLSSKYTDGIREMFASMHQTGVTLYKLMTHTKNPPEGFNLTADEATAFTEAWMDFLNISAHWENEETLRKEQEELQEAERRGKVWLEVDQLAHSVPGMEIVTNYSTEYNYDTGKDEEITAWDVTLARPQYRRFSLYSVDSVLENVKDLVEHYNNYVQAYENYERTNWYGVREQAKQDMIDFLKAHRAFVEQQQKQREEVTPATDALA